MRAKLIIGTALFAAVAIATLGAAPSRRAAAVTFLRPTIIAGAAVLGPVVFEHDDARMARGEPCTHVYRYDAKHHDKGDLIVAFHCIRQTRDATNRFEAIVSKTASGGPDRLLEYQFPNEAEGHGVPYDSHLPW
jgi:hypothetical protein